MPSEVRWKEEYVHLRLLQSINQAELALGNLNNLFNKASTDLLFQGVNSDSQVSLIYHRRNNSLNTTTIPSRSEKNWDNRRRDQATCRETH